MDVANDGTLVRGSEDLEIAAVTYTLLDFKRSNALSSEMDFAKTGKVNAVSHLEGLEIITGTIRQRSDKVTPPKWTVFAFEGKNWYIAKREHSGSAQGLKEYSVEIWECVNGVVVVT